MSGRLRTAVLLLLTTAVACETLLTEPAPLGSEVRVELSVPAATTGNHQFGDLTVVFPLVRNVHFRFVHDGGERDTLVSAVEGSDVLTTRVTLRPEELRGWLEVHAELRTTFQQPLFRGLGLLSPTDVSPTLEIHLTPVAATIGAGSLPVFAALGDTLTMGARAWFVGHTPIPGARIDWESSDPTVVEVLSGDSILSRGNGVATLTGSSLGATADFQISVRQRPVLLTGVGPADTTVAVGSAFQARPFGEDGNGYPLLPGADVQWTGRGAVTVNQNGGVIALSVGTGFVDVQHGTTVHTAQVTVTP